MAQPCSPQRESAAAAPRSPPTPDVTRRIEESRLRAKALQTQRTTAERIVGAPSLPRTSSGLVETDTISLTRKRPHAAVTRSSVPTTNRDARTATLSDPSKEVELKPVSRKFQKYVDYNFSAMTDTKGGFLSTEDDPWNKSMSLGVEKKNEGEQKPSHMSAAEWERLQLIRNLKRNKAGPFEPGLSSLSDVKTRKVCRECGTMDIDFVWEETFGCAVCKACKERFPEKYSLLTKTECREDYLLTEPELKDPELLPHLSKPNPHKSHWHDMMLFLRYQVEEYAFGKKWGSAEALDAEFERREREKKRRKEQKFKEKLQDLKKKTRTDAVRRNNAKAGGSAKGANFGDSIGGTGKHVHEWGTTVENAEGMTVKTCTSCGMEVEELEF